MTLHELLADFAARADYWRGKGVMDSSQIVVDCLNAAIAERERLEAELRECLIVVEAATLVMEAELEPRKRALDTVARLATERDALRETLARVREVVDEMGQTRPTDTHLTIMWDRLDRALAAPGDEEKEGEG